ncbi:OadG family protein [Leptolinea tardivitalis]|uniref:Uncharacterized protein n=1 Tax=Leptolinea tardivitalis TaxID=229920 RepID=A0A0P6X6K6_9CHLR|nr:OadG family protein [Leptolinea tardivitalis]KPL70561.1 hypothetical protein ADM99_15720 [Leptolinea tardivitalis]GAP22169.1 sodium pump decarboxylases, gamma subunit [Leptolinea tardivitalis]
MANDIIPGLIITAIGMGLVFAAIVLLWGLMAGMVRLDARFQPKEETTSVVESSEETDHSALDNHRKAAAAALAVALAQRDLRKKTNTRPVIQPGNSWQSVQRAQVLQDKSRIISHRSLRRD